MKMRTMVVAGTGYDSLQLEERNVPTPGAGEIVVRVHAATLNYRDWLMLHAQSTSGRIPVYVPLSCGAGTVSAIGSGVTRVKEGDRVCPTFFQDWISGPLAGPKKALGGLVDGVASEYVLLSQEGVVHAPATLGDYEAATLPCAALTAWTSLFDVRVARPGDVVLLQGTGGVSIAGLQLAKAAGMTVIITSSSDAKLSRARALGADHLINYKTTPNWGEAAKKLTGGRGVDVVLEVGGMGTLPQSQAALREGGSIPGIGLLTGASFGSPDKPPVKEMVRIRVGSRKSFEAMNRAIVQNGIRPVVDRVYPLEKLSHALMALKSGTVFGKVGIDLN